MPGPRLSPWLLLGAGALGATASERAVAPSPDAAEAERVFCGLVLARNSNDFARASALMADDMRWFDSEGSAHSKNERRLETMLAWEHASSARWSCRVVGFADGWLGVRKSARPQPPAALGGSPGPASSVAHASGSSSAPPGCSTGASASAAQNGA